MPRWPVRSTGGGETVSLNQVTTRTPRVAVVSDYTLDTLGGAENAFAEQVGALAEVTDVLAVCPPSGRLTALGGHPRITSVSVPVAFVAPGLGFPVARHTPRLRARLRHAFEAAGIDVVHVHSEFGIAAAAIAAARELRIPTVQTVHTFFWQTGAHIQTLLAAGVPAFHRLMTGLPFPSQRLAERRGDSALRNMTLATGLATDRVISPSAHQSHHLRQAGLREVDVVPNTVRWNTAARPLTRVDGPLRVLWTGRFSAEKRVLPFLRSSLRALDQMGPGRLQIDVLGTGPQFPAAQRMVEERAGIRLHGRVPHAEVPGWLSRSHVTALTSIGWDNQPMTVAESVMALRGVIWCDPVLTEGLTEAGIPAFGDDENALVDRLTELARDPAPVVAASRAAVSARSAFGAECFTRTVLSVYRRAGVPDSSSRYERPR